MTIKRWRGHVAGCDEWSNKGMPETSLLSNLPPFFQDWLGRVHPPSLTLTWEAGCCRAWAGARAWAWVRRAGASRSQSGRPRGPKAPAWVSTDHPPTPPSFWITTFTSSGRNPWLLSMVFKKNKKNKKKIESNPGMWIRRKTEGWPSRAHDGETFPYWENWGKARITHVRMEGMDDWNIRPQPCYLKTSQKTRNMLELWRWPRHSFDPNWLNWLVGENGSSYCTRRWFREYSCSL